MTETSARLTLPLLAAGQAQKEFTHNEALTTLDIFVQPVVESVAPTVVPASPLSGQCWIVGNAASGAWAGQDSKIAAWTAGGWRFAGATTGMSVWSKADEMIVRRTASNWIIGSSNAKDYRINGIQTITARQPAIALPAGGTTVDAESRAIIGQILTSLRAHGLIAT